MIVEDQKKNTILEQKLKLAFVALEDIYNLDHTYDEYSNNVKRKSYNTLYQLCNEEVEIQEVSISSK